MASVASNREVDVSKNIATLAHVMKTLKEQQKQAAPAKNKPASSGLHAASSKSKFDNLTPEQQALFEKLLGAVDGGDGGDSDTESSGKSPGEAEEDQSDAAGGIENLTKQMAATNVVGECFWPAFIAAFRPLIPASKPENMVSAIKGGEFTRAVRNSKLRAAVKREILKQLRNIVVSGLSSTEEKKSLTQEFAKNLSSVEKLADTLQPYITRLAKKKADLEDLVYEAFAA